MEECGKPRSRLLAISPEKTRTNTETRRIMGSWILYRAYGYAVYPASLERVQEAFKAHG